MNPPFSRRLRGWMNRSVPGMITCGEMEAFLVDYLDGSLPGGQRRRFDVHVRLCPDCRAYLRAYESTIKAGRTAFEDPEDAPPDEVPDELVRSILDARNSDRS